MIANFLSRPSPSAMRRLHRLKDVVLILLAVHFLFIQFAPHWMGYRPIRSSHAVLGGGGQTAGTLTVHGQRKVFERDGRTWLWGGQSEHEHFDITTSHLDPARLNYGLGREAFPALIEPSFVDREGADQWLNVDDRVLALRIEDKVRVYPIDLLVRHEVVNDEVAGVPVFAAYCILADLGAVYDRRYGDHVLTFALTGYTYSDPDIWEGMDAFVLWDRETESLWWPLLSKAVSGPLIDQPLHVLDRDLWSQTTWGEVRDRYPHAKVLQRGQDFERPTNWPRLTADEIEPDADAAADGAPRWGENPMVE